MKLYTARAPTEILLYPGAAGPVSGWWVPMITLVSVTPGAESAAGPPPLGASPAPEHPESNSAPAATTVHMRRTFMTLPCVDEKPGPARRPRPGCRAGRRG